MKKRLRKKLSRGEFTTLIGVISFSFPEEGDEAFQSRYVKLLDEYEEKFGDWELFGMGAGTTFFFDGTAMGNFHERYKEIAQWFQAREELENVKPTPVFSDNEAEYNISADELRRRSPVKVDKKNPRRRRTKREQRIRRAEIGLNPQTLRKEGIHRQERRLRKRAKVVSRS